MLTYRPIDVVEQQIEDHYRQVQLKATGLKQTSDALLAEVSERYHELESERTRQQRAVRQLEDQRTKLMQAHYAGAVPLDLLAEEQARITAEISALKVATEKATATAQKIEETVNKAADWAENCHQAYLASDSRGRRLMNQAFFKRVWVTEEGVVGWEYNEPFKLLMAIHGAPGLPRGPESPKRNLEGLSGHSRGYERRRGLLAEPFSLALGLKQKHLAEEVGFEPTVGCPTHDFQSCRFGRSRTPPERGQANRAPFWPRRPQ